jgi:hypothetical protein
VRLLKAENKLGAKLLDRCEPGTPLRAPRDSQQDVAIAAGQYEALARRRRA